MHPESTINPQSAIHNPQSAIAGFTYTSAVHKTTQEMLASPEFRHLVSRRWRISLVLTASLFVLYYGYILLIAVNKPLLAQRLGGSIPIGIPLGAAVIVGSWILTAVYIVWANRHYDPEAQRLRDTLLTRR
jgi:uncharacterized membrane protein (DUF485 family)